MSWHRSLKQGWHAVTGAECCVVCCSDNPASCAEMEGTGQALFIIRQQRDRCRHIATGSRADCTYASPAAYDHDMQQARAAMTQHQHTPGRLTSPQRDCNPCVSACLPVLLAVRAGRGAQVVSSSWVQPLPPAGQPQRRCQLLPRVLPITRWKSTQFLLDEVTACMHNACRTTPRFT